MILQKLSDYIQLLTYTYKEDHAEIYLLQLFPGISLGINYVNIHRITGDASEAASMDILRMPCLVALASTHRESHSLKWTVKIALYYTFMALLLSCVVYHIGLVVF